MSFNRILSYSIMRTRYNHRPIFTKACIAKCDYLSIFCRCLLPNCVFFCSMFGLDFKLRSIPSSKKYKLAAELVKKRHLKSHVTELMAFLFFFFLFFFFLVSFIKSGWQFLFHVHLTFLYFLVSLKALTPSPLNSCNPSTPPTSSS